MNEDGLIHYIFEVTASLRSFYNGNLDIVTYSSVKVTFSSCSISSLNHR